MPPALRWSGRNRHCTLLDPVGLAESPDHDPGKFLVTFHCRFAVNQPGDPAKGKAEKDAKGETINVYTLARNGPDSRRIAATKEERVRGQKVEGGGWEDGYCFDESRTR